MADLNIIDEAHKISDKRGNGKLRREVWVDEATKQVSRYNLAYINHSLYAGDNGRVVGYDNAHDVHHRHYFGVVEPIEFVKLERAGLVTVSEKVLPGHGRMKEVRATALRFSLQAEIA